MLLFAIGVSGPRPVPDATIVPGGGVRSRAQWIEPVDIRLAVRWVIGGCLLEAAQRGQVRLAPGGVPRRFPVSAEYEDKVLVVVADKGSRRPLVAGIVAY